MKHWPLAFLFLLPFAGAADGESRPNIVFILGDDQAWWDYSFMRQADAESDAIAVGVAANGSASQPFASALYPVAETPNIDRLANNGLTFVQGYVPVSLCRPSLMSIITGTYPHQHRVTGNDLASGSDAEMERQVMLMQSLPRILSKRLGYTSFQTGKWWEADFANGGFGQGDTVNTTGTSQRPSQWLPTSRPGYAPARHGDWGLMIGRVDYVNGVLDPASPIPYANTVTPVTDFIDAQVATDQPFFVWYAPFLPHTPHDPPTGLLDKYDNLISEPNEAGDHQAKYYANIERLDGGVGAILDHLEASGIAGNTIVIFMCDNGWVTQNNASAFAAKSKRSSYDGGVRTPIIVSWPDKIKAGGEIEPRMIKTPVNTIDLVPTALAALGLAPSPEMRGINLLDAGAVNARDTIFGDVYAHDVQSVDVPVQTLEARWARRDGWKLILPASGPTELYHLYDESGPAPLPVDPFETNNLARVETLLVTELTMAITHWYAEKKSLAWRSGAGQNLATNLTAIGTGIGQTWTPSSETGFLAAINVVLKPTAPGQSLTLEVRERDIHGEPNGTVLASSKLPAGQFLNNELREYSFPFEQRVAVTTGQQVGFRLVPEPANGGFEVAYASDGYAEGRMVYDGLLEGRLATNGAFDLRFDVLLANYAERSAMQIRTDGDTIQLTGLMNVKQQPATLLRSEGLTTWSPQATDDNLDGLVAWDLPINTPREYFGIGVGGAGDEVTLMGPTPDPAYTESFNGTGLNLNGMMPDTAAVPSTWTAPAGGEFWDDGTVTGTGGASAYLPFVPQHGHVYTLSVQIQQSAIDIDVWAAFGFLSNPASVTPIHSGSGGVIWALTRNLSLNDNQVLHENVSGGTGSLHRGDFVTGEATVPMSLVLDTTGGSGNWTYDWIVDGSARLSNQPIGVAFESIIGAVGIGKNKSPNLEFISFSLTTD